MSGISRRLGFSYEDIVGEYDDELTNLAMEENDFFSKEFEDYGVNKHFEAKIKKEFGL